MGTKSKKKAKTRLDAYYRLAKDQGYRARSAFKLIQLNRKYDFLAKSKVLVDLCAAPGGWCQVAAKHMPIGSKIVGVDLVPIAPIRGCKTFVGDITDDKTRKMVVTWLKKEPVDCVIHDGAPNVGGVWSRDLFEQNALVLCAAKMATALLRPGGWFVTKVFRSQDFQKLMWVMKQLFDKVEATKPLASRMESAEIFVVCAGYKAPKHLDPKMFHAQSVFADVAEEKIVNAAGILVTPKNNVPQGYDEFATITHNVATLSDFLHCREPRDFLKTHHEIRFPEEDRHMLKSKHSRKELVYLCHDLLQVGEGDRRRLIRWREQLLREQQRAAQDEAAGDDNSEIGSDAGAAAGSDNEGEDTQQLLGDGEGDVTEMARQLLEIRKHQAKELKKKQKKLVDRKLKQVKGLINYDPTASADHLTDTTGFDYKGAAALDADGIVDTEEGAENANDWTIANVGAIDEERLSKLMDKHFEDPEADRHLNDPLAPVMGATLGDEDDVDLGSGDDKDDDDEAGSDEDDDVIRPLPVGQSLQVIEGREESYDVDYYGNYIVAEKSNRVRLFEEGFGNNNEDEEGEEDDDNMSPQEKKVAARKAKDTADLDEAGKQSKWQRRHLNIDKVLNRTFPKPRDPKKRNKRLEEDQIELDNGSDDDAAAAGKKAKADKGPRMKFGAEADDDTDDSEDDYVASDISSLGGNASDDNDDFEVRKGRQDTRKKRAIIPDIGKLTAMELVKQQRKQTTKDNKTLRRENKKNKASGKKKDKKEDTTFEEIPIALTDPDIRARTHAIATKMLDKRSRRDILDASINRFMNNDDDDLPDWFVKDEQRNCKVILPVTAADVENERNRFRELNARPGKKVMEAQGRKRRKAQRMLRGLIEKGKSDPRARQKANGTSVRTLMRSTAIKGENINKKKNKPLDPKSMGEKKRTRQRLKRQGKGKR